MRSDPKDRVLDIGCGAGRTTRDAARLASDGSALGVDISPEMIEQAQRLANAEGFHNVTFEHADAQDHRFPSERFDLAISRFGTMFFRDPVAAFTNIGSGLRQDGRLVIMVWQGARTERVVRGHPEGAVGHCRVDGSRLRKASITSLWPIPRRSGASWRRLASPTSRSPTCAGPCTSVRTLPTRSGGSVASASTKGVVDALDPASRELALERLRETLVANAREDGVWFDSRAWLVKARRP